MWQVAPSGEIHNPVRSTWVWEIDIETLISTTAIVKVCHENVRVIRQARAPISDGDDSTVHVHFPISDSIEPRPCEYHLPRLCFFGDIKIKRTTALDRAFPDVGLHNLECCTLVLGNGCLTRPAFVGCPSNKPRNLR